MKRITTVLAVLFFAFTTAAAVAADGQGYYVTAGVGFAQLAHPDQAQKGVVPPANYAISDTSIAWRVGGGYGLSDHVRAELDYRSLGRYSSGAAKIGTVASTPATGRVDGVALSIIGSVNAVYLRGGVMASRAVLDAGGISTTHHEARPFFGAGVTFARHVDFELTAYPWADEGGSPLRRIYSAMFSVRW